MGAIYRLGSTPRPSRPGRREEMESPPRLGLITICIVPLRGKTDLTTKVWVRSLGTDWEGVMHLRLPDLWVDFHSLYLTSYYC